MTWSDLILDEPPSKHDTRSQPVVLSCSKRGRFRQRVFIRVRPELLGEGAPTWWAAGRYIRVQAGFGEHAGRWRLSPETEGRKHKLSAAQGRGGAVQLALLGYPHLPALGKREVVEFDFQEDWIELTLPAWMQPAPAPATAAAPVPKVALPRGQAFQGPFHKPLKPRSTP